MKTKILIFSEYFSPGYKAGGPIRSIINIVEGLKDHSEVYIITKNRDWSEAVPYPDIPENEWVLIFENVNALYLDPKKIIPSVLKKHIEIIKPSWIFLNSIYSPLSRNVFMVLLRNKINYNIAVAVRGELSTKAISIRFFLKVPYLLALRGSGLTKRIVWLSTNLKEYAEIKKVFGKKRQVKVIDNIPRNDKVIWNPLNKTRGNLRLIFLSRIDKMKNLHFLLSILNKLDFGNIILDIYGSVKDKTYLQQCNLLISKLPSNIKVSVCGSVNSHNVLTVLKKYHFLVQPSLSENFGHSIFEAFLCGIPVIISDRTPWRNLEEKSIGWDLDIFNESQWIHVLNYALNMDDTEYRSFSKNAIDFSQHYLKNHQSIKEIRKLFLSETYNVMEV